MLNFQTGYGGKIEGWIVWSIFLLFLVVGVARILATYPVLSQVLDEPASIACGMEWIDKGTYTIEPLHPPLARVLTAVGPYMAGARSSGKTLIWHEGNTILHHDDAYWLNLSLARLGILPFFVMGTLVVFLWARVVFGTTIALIAAGIFTTLPPILAHSGFATMDTALASTILLALYVYDRFVKKPGFRRALFFGAACGLAILTKFTAGVFLTVAILSHVLVGALYKVKGQGARYENYRPRSATFIAVALLAAFLTLWAGYRFSYGPVPETGQRPFNVMGGIFKSSLSEAGPERNAGEKSSILERWSWPAPEFLQGIKHAKLRDSVGSFSYLFGKTRRGGWWYYYPVVLLFKTPLPILFLMTAGILVILGDRRRRGDPDQLMLVVFPLVILLSFLPSEVNNGVRQILVVYGFLSILAALGLTTVFSIQKHKTPWRGLVVLLSVWYLAGGIAVHPDYVASFNELAMGKPEKVLVEADLDWGQDLGRLVRTVNELGIKNLALGIVTTADLMRFSLPTLKHLEPMEPVSGWVAISFWRLKHYNTDRFTKPPSGWLEQYTPYRRVGRSILLYHIREDTKELRTD